MSRHRNVRGMNYDDDYDGYDEVYGHSVEDEYGVSPGTAEEFLYRRSYHEHHLGKYMEDIGEGEEGEDDGDQPLADSKTYQKPKLSDVDEARLQSCLDEIHNVVGDSTPEHILIQAVLSSNFVIEKAIDTILNQEEAKSKKSGQHRKDENKSKVLGQGNLNTMHDGKSVKKLGATRPPNGASDGAKLQSPGALGKLSMQSNSSPLSQSSSLNPSSNSLSSLMQRQSGSGPMKPLSGQGLSLADLAQTHLSSSPQSEGKTVGLELPTVTSKQLGGALGGLGQHQGPSLSSLAASHMSSGSQSSGSLQGLGVSTAPEGGGLCGLSLSSLAKSHLSSVPPISEITSGLRSSSSLSGGGLRGLSQSGQQAGESGNSLASLASKHLDTHSGLQYIPPLGSGNCSQTSLQSLAGAQSGQTTSGAISGLPSMKPTKTQVNLNNQMSALSISQQRESSFNLPQKGLSLGDLASQHLAAECGITNTAQSSGAFKSPLRAASRDFQNTSSSVPSLFSLSQMKLSEPRKASLPDNPPQGVRTINTLEKKTSRPPPGFGEAESSKKTKLSAPPGFKPHESGDSPGHDYLMHDVSSDKPISRPHTLDHHMNFITCKPSVFGRILTSMYIPPISLLNTHLRSHKSVTPDADQSATTGQEKTLHRQFSYERQTSISSTGEDAMETIVHFDFSTPSPDDVVKARQSRAFVSGGHWQK